MGPNWWHPHRQAEAAAMQRCLRELIRRAKIWHPLPDTPEPFARCRVSEEQELGREQVLDEARWLIKEIDKLNKELQRRCVEIGKKAEAKRCEYQDHGYQDQSRR